MSDMANVEEFERFADEFSNPPTRLAADAYFNSVRQQENALLLCRSVLERSSHDPALFQAVTAMRIVALREWPRMALADVIALRHFVIEFAFARPHQQSYVLNALTRATGSLAKRGWLDESEESRGAFVSYIINVVENLRDAPQSQLVGLLILKELCVEFSANSSSEMSMPWEFHFQCHTVFESGELRRVFVAALGIVSGLMELPSLSDEQIRVLREALILMETALSWDFSNASSRRKGAGSFKHRLGDRTEALQPSAEWRDLFASPALVQTLFELHMRVRAVADLGPKVRHSLSRLAALRGVFPDDESRVAYLGAMLHGVLLTLREPLAPDPEAANRHLLERFDLCEIIHQLMIHFGRGDVQQLPTAEAFLDELCALSCANLPTEPLTQAEDGYVLDINKHLQSAWVALIGDEPNMSGLARWVQPVFEGYLRWRLARARRGRLTSDNPVEDEDSVSDQLDGVSRLARVDTVSSLRALCGLLQAQGAALADALNRPDTPERELAAINAELVWLVRVLSHVVADECDGEAVAIPAALVAASQMAAEQEMEDPIIASVSQVFQLIQIENALLAVGPPKDPRISGELGVALLQFLQRWCPSYLLHAPSRYVVSSPTLLAAYGARDVVGDGGEGGAAALDFVLRYVLARLLLWDNDEEVARQASRLLLVLAKIDKVPSVALYGAALPELASAITRQQGAIALYPATHTRTLYYALSQMAKGTEQNLEQRAQYLTGLAEPLESGLSSVMSGALDAGVEPVLARILEGYRGLVTPSLSQSSQIVFACVARSFAALAHLAARFADHEVALLAIELLAQTAESQLPYLGMDASRELFTGSLKLLQDYSAARTQGLMHARADGVEENDDEADAETLAILRLLVRLLDKNDFDFAEGGGMADDATNVVFFGLELLLPLVHNAALEVPRIAEGYFNLIHRLAHEHVEKMGSLSPALFHLMVSSIVYGMKHPTVEICKTSFETLAALLEYQVRTGGLAPQLDAQPMVLNDLLEAVFAALVFEEFDLDLLPCAAAALFSLLCLAHAAYMEGAQKLIAQQAPALQERLSAAFHHLMTGRGVAASFDKVNQKNFKDNLRDFLVEVRSFLRTK